LRQGVTPYGKAPHKPILLLSLIDGIEQGWIVNNQVPITPELVAAFKENWSLLVDTHHQADFTQPFYYLQTEGFWHVVTRTGQAMPAHIRSIQTLNTLVSYGTFDEPLYAFLLEPGSRTLIRQALLDTYFPLTKINYRQNQQPGAYIQAIENKLLNEPATVYASEIRQADEEEVFVRGGVFKKMVPKVYKYACCISGMQVTSIYDVSLVDACHIVPFSVSHNDTIGNGISLCPNLHRAFDRGLISIDAEYRVLISDSFSETEESPYSFRQWQGKPIALPANPQYYPSPENLATHREKRFERDRWML
jgi:putative restriction endonuclease